MINRYKLIDILDDVIIRRKGVDDITSPDK